MATSRILIDATWMAVFGVVYFRVVVSTDRDMQRFHHERYIEANGRSENDLIRDMESKGMVSFYDPRIIALSTILAAASFLAPFISGTLIHEILIYISIGAFLLPLSFPSSLWPTPEDLSRPVHFVGKWLLAKLDTAWRLLTFWGVLTFFSYVPGVSTVFEWLFNRFPVVKSEPASDYFLRIAQTGGAVMVLVYVFRWGMIAVYGIWQQLLFGLATVNIWVLLQWFVNRVYSIEGSALQFVSLGLVSMLALDLLQTLLHALAESMRRTN